MDQLCLFPHRFITRFSQTELILLTWISIIQQKHSDLASLQAQSTGEDSNSSDTAASDAGDIPLDGMNGSMEHSRTPTFPGSFLGLQGLLPGPSGLHGNDNFGEFLTNFFQYS